jgi:hypothetical protein
MGMASGSAIETWFGVTLTSLPYFACASWTVKYRRHRRHSYRYQRLVNLAKKGPGTSWIDQFLMYGRMKKSSGNASSVQGVNSRDRNMIADCIQNRKEPTCSYCNEVKCAEVKFWQANKTRGSISHTEEE